MPMRLVKLQISNFCFRFPFKHPDAIKQIEPSSKTAYAAPYQGLPVSHIIWEGCCLHKQKKLTPSLLGFTSNFAGDCTREGGHRFHLFFVCRVQFTRTVRVRVRVACGDAAEDQCICAGARSAPWIRTVVLCSAATPQQSLYCRARVGP